MAEREGVSLNQFLVATIAERLGAEKTLLAFRRWNLQYAANVGELMQGRIQDMVVYRAPERGASAAMVANIQVRDVWKAPRQEGEKQRA